MKFPAHAFKTDLTPIFVVSEIKSGKRSLMGTNTKMILTPICMRFYVFVELSKHSFR